MFKTITSAALLIALCAPAVAAPGNIGCYLYKDTNYRGDEWALWGGNVSISNLKQKRGWDDEVSSARVIGNCQLTLFEDRNFRGAGVFINTEMANLKIINSGFNDETSSVKCICN